MSLSTFSLPLAPFWLLTAYCLLKVGVDCADPLVSEPNRPGDEGCAVGEEMGAGQLARQPGRVVGWPPCGKSLYRPHERADD